MALAPMASLVLLLLLLPALALGDALVEPREVGRSVTDLTNSGVGSTASTLSDLEVWLEVSAGMVTIDVDGAPFSFWARLYNGSFPGPTLRVQPQQRLTIHLTNNLAARDADILESDQASLHRGVWDPKQDCYCADQPGGQGRDADGDGGVGPGWHQPNITNMHLHGMHIDPATFNHRIRIEPGQTHTFTAEIDRHHHVGTQWYHPHFHGSTALQVGGGMAGALVVDDLPGTGGSIAAIPDTVLMLQQLRFGPSPFSKMEPGPMTAMFDHRWLATNMGDRIEPPPTNITTYVVNGQHKPTLTLVPGKYRRLRFINAAAVSFLEIQLADRDPQDLGSDDAESSGDTSSTSDGEGAGGDRRRRVAEEARPSKRDRRHGGEPVEGASYNPEDVAAGDRDPMPAGCLFQLVALDGVYLQEPGHSPLAVNQVVMAPGNRADVLIRCASPTRLVLRSVSKLYNDGFLGHLTERYTGDLMYIDVVGEFTGNDTMPQDIPTPEDNYSMMDWREIPFSTKVQNESFMMSHECSPATTGGTPPHPGLGGVQFCINGESYADRVFQHDFPLTCVQDWRIANHDIGMNHPWHMHVNHFQIIESSSNEAFWAPIRGNYMDTLTLPSEITEESRQPSWMRVMFYPRLYTGSTVMHCHILAHADAGMMLHLNITDQLPNEHNRPGMCPANRSTPLIPVYTPGHDGMAMPPSCTCNKSGQIISLGAGGGLTSASIMLVTGLLIGSVVAVLSLMSWRVKRTGKIKMLSSLYVELQDRGAGATLSDPDSGVQEGTMDLSSPARKPSTHRDGHNPEYSPGGSLKHRLQGASRA